MLLRDDGNVTFHQPGRGCGEPLAIGRTMRIALKALGVVLMLVGAVWFLQGIGVLPGSFMTGQSQWAIYGGISFIAGACSFFAGGKLRRPPDGE
jgi:hypothetical protein